MKLEVNDESSKMFPLLPQATQQEILRKIAGTTFSLAIGFEPASVLRTDQLILAARKTLLSKTKNS